MKHDFHVGQKVKPIRNLYAYLYLNDKEYEVEKIFTAILECHKSIIDQKFLVLKDYEFPVEAALMEPVKWTKTIEHLDVKPIYPMSKEDLEDHRRKHKPSTILKMFYKNHDKEE
jgi:hypothetical protein